MPSIEHRFNRSRSMARLLSGITGISRMVLSSAENSQTFIVATAQEHQKLYGGNKDLVLWSN